jgi:hypothetical protein
VVFLATDSADSRFKKAAYAKAARNLGLAVRDYPDAHTIGIVPTSDYRALDAAWMCAARGLPGPSPIAAAIAMSKSLTYELLRRKGFELLFWMVPNAETDLEIGFDRPVIVKPDLGSGSISKLPWGYRVFDNLREFRRYLQKERMVERFFSQQSAGGSGNRSLIMEYVEAPEVYSIATVAGDGAPALYDSNEFSSMPGSQVIGRMLVGRRHPDTARALKMVRALADAGLRRTVIYLQCMERAGRLVPVDLNLRPGAMWSLAAAKLRTGAFEELLSVMLGRKARAKPRWPARYVGIARVPLPLREGRFGVAAGRGALSLLPRIAYDRRRYYDVGHAWPMLAVTCDTPGEFERRLPELMSTVRVTRLAG